MNWRMVAPENPAQQSRVVNGRAYTATAGQLVIVPDFDGMQLQANGWTFLAASGPTSARPTGSLGLYTNANGAEFFDETLGLLIKSDGVVWRNPATGAVV